MLMSILALLTVLLLVALLASTPSQATSSEKFETPSHVSGIRVEYTQGEVSARTYFQASHGATHPSAPTMCDTDLYASYVEPVTAFSVVPSYVVDNGANLRAQAYVLESPGAGSRQANGVDRFI